MAGIAALVACGCKRPAAAPAEPETTNTVEVDTNAPPPPPVQVTSRTTDLGVVQLTDRYETRIDLTNGKSCTITPRLIDSKHLRLTMSLQSKSANGLTTDLKVVTVVARPDEQFQMDFGNMDFVLTPQMADGGSGKTP